MLKACPWQTSTYAESVFRLPVLSGIAWNVFHICYPTCGVWCRCVIKSISAVHSPHPRHTHSIHSPLVIQARPNGRRRVALNLRLSAPLTANKILRVPGGQRTKVGGLQWSYDRKVYSHQTFTHTTLKKGIASSLLLGGWHSS